MAREEQQASDFPSVFCYREARALGEKKAGVRNGDGFREQLARMESSGVPYQLSNGPNGTVVLRVASSRAGVRKAEGTVVSEPKDIAKATAKAKAAPPPHIE